MEVERASLEEAEEEGFTEETVAYKKMPVGSEREEGAAQATPIRRRIRSGASLPYLQLRLRSEAGVSGLRGTR